MGRKSISALLSKIRLRARCLTSDSDLAQEVVDGTLMNECWPMQPRHQESTVAFGYQHFAQDKVAMDYPTRPDLKIERVPLKVPDLKKIRSKGTLRESPTTLTDAFTV